MMILKLATGEIYFNDYFYKICCLRRGGEQDQLVFIGQINFQKSAVFSESTIISNVFRKIGLLQNQLESDDVSARVLTNAHMSSDERSASNCRKKVSCLYFRINEDIAVQVKVFIKTLPFAPVYPIWKQSLLLGEIVFLHDVRPLDSRWTMWGKFIHVFVINGKLKKDRSKTWNAVLKNLSISFRYVGKRSFQNLWKMINAILFSLTKKIIFSKRPSRKLPKLSMVCTLRLSCVQKIQTTFTRSNKSFPLALQNTSKDKRT